MTNDLSKLKAGDTVHFRCGGKAVVVGISQSADMIWVKMTEAWGYNYGLDGKVVPNIGGFCIGETPFDIIRVESAFQLGPQNVGEEFILSGNYAEYIGFCQTENRHVFWLKGCGRLVFLSGNPMPTDRIAIGKTNIIEVKP